MENVASTASVGYEKRKRLALINATNEKNETLELLTEAQKEAQQFKDLSEKYMVCLLFFQSSKT